MARRTQPSVGMSIKAPPRTVAVPSQRLPGLVFFVDQEAHASFNEDDLTRALLLQYYAAATSGWFVRLYRNKRDAFDQRQEERATPLKKLLTGSVHGVARRSSRGSRVWLTVRRSHEVVDTEGFLAWAGADVLRVVRGLLIDPQIVLHPEVMAVIVRITKEALHNTSNPAKLTVNREEIKKVKRERVARGIKPGDPDQFFAPVPGGDTALYVEDLN